jgi:type IV pilus biogenesis protein CpaD/CtpE
MRRDVGTFRACVLVVVSLAISGCANTDSVSGNKTYNSVHDMRTVIERDAGIQCDCWMVFSGFNQGALQRADCTRWIVLSVYATSSDAQRAASETIRLTASSGITSRFLVGQNWTVNCGAYCDALQPALGGSVVSR